MPKSPKIFKSRSFKDPQAVLDAVTEVYESNIAYLRMQFEHFVEGKTAPDDRITACYPYIKISAKNARRADTRLAYGFVPRPGTYSTTITRPDIFKSYYLEQVRLLILNHDVPIEVGVSQTPIPIHFALGSNFHIENGLTPEQLDLMPQIFDIPDLDVMDDEIANGTHFTPKGEASPLALFTAPRVDLSLQRLKHYCGTSAEHFQNYIIFTNYQFYIDEFVRLCHSLMAPTEDAAMKKQRSIFTAFVEPGDRMTLNKNAENYEPEIPAAQQAIRMPQMPAYHLKMPGGQGITLINIGVGPSNAKTITDHCAVLRPHAWLMLGHCAGLRNSQRLGDYVLAHGYLREDNILDEEVPVSIPIPALSEIQQSLELAVSQVTGNKGFDLKKFMRTGTVATTADRNWELRSFKRQQRRLSQSRAIAMDMESGTIAANGFRFRVPYGTLLCVSDKPLHGQLKLPGMADSFYRERVKQHLQIGLLTMTLLRDFEPERIHSRKLRSFNEVAFQ
jgi:AMP nucleosidase